MLSRMSLVTAVLLLSMGCGQAHKQKSQERSTDKVSEAKQEIAPQTPSIKPKKMSSPVKPEENHDFETDFWPRTIPLPRHFNGDGDISVEEKRCGKCRRRVPNSSASGMRCPHCGVRWSIETKSDQDGFSF